MYWACLRDAHVQLLYSSPFSRHLKKSAPIFLISDLGGRCSCPYSSDEETVQAGERGSNQLGSLR